LRAFSGAWAATNFETAAHAPGKSHVRQAAVEQGTTFKPHVTKADFAAGWAVEM
jgi:hypothetical protein